MSSNQSVHTFTDAGSITFDHILMTFDHIFDRNVRKKFPDISFFVATVHSTYHYPSAVDTVPAII